MGLILGVDPGLSGALALYNRFSPEMPFVIADMPTLRLSRNGKNKNEIDYYALARLIDSWTGDGLISAAYVERVGAMPGQGVSSVFSFGRSAGIIIGIIAAHFIPIVEVSAVTWKRSVGIKSGSGKDSSRALISSMFPSQSGQFVRVKDDGRADAALISVYGARLDTERAA